LNSPGINSPVQVLLHVSTGLLDASMAQRIMHKRKRFQRYGTWGQQGPAFSRIATPTANLAERGGPTCDIIRSQQTLLLYT
jgi:hypothetical protein